MSQETIIVYFGCWGQAGHFLWLPNRQHAYDHEIREMVLPTAAQLDASKLFLPRPEKVGTGTITYLPALNRTILAWWGNNPWDKRGKVNSAIITNGNLGEIELWQRFVRYFPDLSAKLAVPQTVPDTRKANDHTTS